MINSVSAPALYPLLGDNHEAWVVVASIVFFVYSFLAVGAKLLIRHNVVSLQSHDLVLVIGTVLLFGQTVCTILLCNSGLGRHQDSLNTDALTRFNKVSMHPPRLNTTLMAL